MRLCAGFIYPADSYTAESNRSYLPSNCWCNGVLQLSTNMTLWGQSLQRVFDEPNSSPCELEAAEQPPISAAASSSAGGLNEANVNSLPLAALKQFKDQAALEQFEDLGTNRVLLFALEGYEDSGTQQEDTKRHQPKC